MMKRRICNPLEILNLILSAISYNDESEQLSPSNIVGAYDSMSTGAYQKRTKIIEDNMIRQLDGLNVPSSCAYDHYWSYAVKNRHELVVSNSAIEPDIIIEILDFKNSGISLDEHINAYKTYNLPFISYYRYYNDAGIMSHILVIPRLYSKNLNMDIVDWLYSFVLSIYGFDLTDTKPTPNNMEAFIRAQCCMRYALAPAQNQSFINDAKLPDSVKVTLFKSWHLEIYGQARDFIKDTIKANESSSKSDKTIFCEIMDGKFDLELRNYFGKRLQDEYKNVTQKDKKKKIKCLKNLIAYYGECITCTWFSSL